jgi:hypothetical protein
MGILDASIGEVPVQRNSRDENRELKEGGVPKTGMKINCDRKIRRPGGNP